jgi:hypothetical protein
MDLAVEPLGVCTLRRWRRHAAVALMLLERGERSRVEAVDRPAAGRIPPANTGPQPRPFVGVGGGGVRDRWT